MKRIFCLLICLAALLLCACERTSPGEPLDSGESESTAAHQHEYATTVVAPSCTDGYTIYTCIDCGHSYTDGYIESTGHRYTSVLTDVFCNELRYYVHTCEDCGYSYTSKTDLHGTRHSMEKVGTVPPSREEGGYTLYICTRCKQTEQREHVAPVDFSLGLTYRQQGSGVVVSGVGTCTDTAIVIPSVNEHGQTVIGIGDGAFADQAWISSIEMPDSIRTIGARAFANTRLTELTLPAGVTALSESVLEGCTQLRLLTLHADLLSIGQRALAGCTALTSIDLPASLLTLGNHAFTGSGLTHVKIPASLTAIPEGAFLRCASLTSVELHDNVTSIGGAAFAETALTSFTYPKNIIGPVSAFENCTQLSHVTLTGGARRIDGFEGCTALESIAIPEGITEIDSRAFYGCTALKEVSLPESLTLIGPSAFWGCTSLEAITIPSGVSAVEDRTFEGCTALASVTLREGVTEIMQYAFSGCTALESIEFPSTLKKLGSVAFGCTGLCELVIPAHINAGIGSAFRSCKSLTRVTVYSALGSHIFYDCTALREVVLGEGITEIPKYAFASCTSLESITLPDSLQTVGERAFDGCTGLKSLTIPRNVTSIHTVAFNGCTAITELTLLAKNLKESGAFYDLEHLTVGAGVESIPSGLCYGSNLRELSLPDSVRTIGSNAFYDCKELAGAILSTSLEEIGPKAFGFTAISSICIQSEHVQIGDEAFASCEALQSVELRVAQATICSRAFTHCTALGSIDFSDARVSMDSFVFWGCEALQSVSGTRYLQVSSDKIFPSHLYRTENALVLCLSSLVAIDADEIDSTVALPEGITYIAPEVFRDCNVIKSVILPSTLRQIGDYAFSGCTRLRSVEFQDGLEKLGAGVFSGCTALESVVLPDGLEKLGAGVFNGCTALESVVFPDGVKELPSLVLGNCPALTEISLGGGIAQIAPDFYTCPDRLGTSQRELYTVYYRGSAANWASVVQGEKNPLATCTIVCTDQTIVNLLYQGSVYNVFHPGCTYKVFSDQTLVLFGEGFFPLDFSVNNPHHFKRVKRLVVTEGITGVEHKGFSAFERLETIELAETVTCFPIENLSRTPWYAANEPLKNQFFIVGGRLLDASTELEGAITLPSDITVIGAHAFERCNKITELTLPAGVTLIGGSAFNMCGSLRRITIPEGVTEIGAQAFLQCTVLENVTLPQSLQIIGSDPFSLCHAMTEIVIPQNVISHDMIASNCDNLRAIVFLGSAPISSHVVWYCDALEYVQLGEGLLTLSDQAIYDCDNLRAIVIPESLTTAHSGSILASCSPMLFFRSSTNAEAITAVLNEGRTSSPLVAYLYSEQPPTEAGNWWHFDENGVPVAYE